MKLIQWLLSLFQRPNIEPAAPAQPAPKKRTLAWGNKVGAEFREAIFQICAALGIDSDYLMACIAWESAETFRPDIKNMAGSGATGLIQFMPPTAIGLKTTVEKLAAMTAVEQLAYVKKYFEPYKGRLKTLADVYMAILWPAAIGKPESYVLWEKASKPTTYRQNIGLDINKDEAITKAEAAAMVQVKLVRGRTQQFLWVAP